MQREAESEAGYFAFVKGGTERPIADYLKFWQDVSLESARETAHYAAKLHYLKEIDASFQNNTNNTRANSAFKNLLLTWLNPMSSDGKWLAEWLPRLSFQNFFKVCRAGSRLLQSHHHCKEVGDAIVELLNQDSNRITVGQYSQAYKLLQDEKDAQRELTRRWDECKCRRLPFR